MQPQTGNTLNIYRSTC